MHDQRLTLSQVLYFWLAITLAWFITSDLLKVAPYVVATPAAVATFAQDNATRLLQAATRTGAHTLVALLLAMALGLGWGALIQQSRVLSRMTMPILAGLQATPLIAIASIAYLVLGSGNVAQVIIATFVAVLPIVIATSAGLQAVHPNYVSLFQLAGATKLRTFIDLRLPSALPVVAPAVRTAALLAVVGSVVAEFMGGDGGLGLLILTALYKSRSDELIAGAILCAMLGQIVLLLIDVALRQKVFARILENAQQG